MNQGTQKKRLDEWHHRERPHPLSNERKEYYQMKQFYNATLLMSTYQTKTKSESVDKVGLLSRHSKVVTLSLNEVVEKLREGHTIIPSEMIDGVKKVSWVSSQIIFLDVDNTSLSYDEFVKTVKNIGHKPFVIYTTLSSNEQKPKYRVGYYLSQLIEDIYEYEANIRGLKVRFAEFGIEVDSQCLNANRIFFPAKEIIHEDYEAVLDLNAVTQVYGSDEKAKQLRLEGFTTDNPIVEALSNGDIETVRNMSNIVLPSNFDDLDFYDKINSIKISEFFNLPVGKNFSDFFSEDSNPSCSIFQAKNSEVYKSFNTGDAYSLIELIGRICECTGKEALVVIEAVIGRKLSSEYQLKMREALMYHKAFFIQEIKKHEDLYRVMNKRNLISFYLLLLDIAFTKVTNYPLNGSNNLTFFASRDHILSLNRTFYKVRGAFSQDTIVNKINDLATLGLITKEKDIKNKRVKERAIQYRAERGFKYRINFISINMRADVLVEANQMAIKTDAKNSKRAKNSVHMFSQLGEEKTKEVYNQSNIKSIKEAYAKQIALTEPIFESIIKEKGYCTDEMVKQELISRKFSKNRAKTILNNVREHFKVKYDLLTLSNEMIEERKLADVKPRMKIYVEK